MSSRAAAYFDQMVARRLAGEPLQYVLGRWGFRQLELVVDRRVLIPRPETEQVVEVALAELSALVSSVTPAFLLGSAVSAFPEGSAVSVGSEPSVGPGVSGGYSFPEGPVVSGVAAGAALIMRTAGPVVVDLGTGSGAIALSIAAEAAAGAVWATDASADALAIARANLVGLGGSRAAKVRLVEGWWWDALPASLRGQVSLVVSNPPYVTTDEMASLPPVVADWEPHDALHGGPIGLDAIEVIVAGAPAWLARPGALVVEISPPQAAAVEALARAAGFQDIRVQKDLAGRDRVLVARLRGPG